MLRLYTYILCIFVAAAALAGDTPKSDKTATPAEVKTEVKTAAKPADYSREPFVVEQLYTRMRFENDGTGRREMTARIKVQSDAGVERMGQLVEGYSSANERFEVGYVRVRKADGTVITAGPDAVQELTPPVSREAPMYSDFRQKHITVPGLRPGETLEYQFIITLHTPLAPGHFWTEHSFAKDIIVLDEQLQIDVPRARSVKLKTAKGADPKITEQGDRRIYRWTSSNLVRDDDDDKDKKKKKKRTSEPEPPAVQLTTFESWDQVGRWYASLEKERRAPSPEVRARAAALTAGRATDLEKIEALYDFVAKNYRYVSLSFGMGRYQPHSASEVLVNEYGDCKDKHTLLASLLQAGGFQANTALIHTVRKLDPDVPSPSQFDHVITLVPLGNDSIWLDTTTEVAPFRLLAFAIRKKQALVIRPDGAASLVETPADPPFPAASVIEATGQISELGKLVLKVKEQMRGDAELGARLVFRRVPEPQWKQMGKYIASTLGAQAEMTEFAPSSPNATAQPFSVNYTISLANYLDWSSKKSNADIPGVMNVTLPAPEDDDSTEPLKLGPPNRATLNMRLTFPEAYTLRLPLSVSVARDYGLYRSEYKLEGHTLVITRTFELKQAELPAARMADYRAFRRSILADFEQHIGVESVTAGKPSVPEGTKVEELFEAAYAAQGARSWDTALALYKRVVALEPKHKSAWNNLGQVHMALAQIDEAIASFRTAIEVNPYDEFAYNNLGRAYWTKHNYEDAVAAFQKQIEVSPLDKYAHTNLGHLFLEQRRYNEALAELEKAASLTPDDATLKVAIGQAYLNLDQPDKALAAFDQAVETSPTPTVWNNIAYELSLKKVHLDRAQKYAESAVDATAATLRNLTLDNAPDRVPEFMSNAIASYWDTLGWVHFQRGNLDQAELYILPAWQLSESAEVGDHLGQIYEKRGDRAKAIRYYALGLAGAGRANPDTRVRLGKLLGGEAKVDAEVSRFRGQLSADRTIRLGKLAKENASAEFTVLLTPGPKVEAVKFVKGSDTLKPLAEVLRNTRFTQAFPDNSAVRLARRGILSCSVSECLFVFVPTDALLESQARMELQKLDASSGKAK